MCKKFENIYYTGGSYTMIYQVGVSSYLSRKYDINKINWYGCSAGALAIVLMFILPPDKILQYYLDIVDDMKKLIEKNPFDLNNYNLTDRHFAALQVIHETDPEAYKSMFLFCVNIEREKTDKNVWMAVLVWTIVPTYQKIHLLFVQGLINMLN
jgi:hypothetical protein